MTESELRAAAGRLIELGTHPGVRPGYEYERAVRESAVPVARALLGLLRRAGAAGAAPAGHAGGDV
jgi:hypothetical protein